MDLWQSVLANAPARVEYLVTQGEVHVDERNDLGETALHLACSHGLDDVAIVLIAHGAELSLQDWESGWTPLHRSVYQGHLSTTLLLLRHARQTHGRAFLKTLLYDTKDSGHQSAMQLVGAYFDKTKTSFTEIYDEENHETEEKVDKRVDDEATAEQTLSTHEQRGGMVYTFGKVDFQLGYHLPHVNVQSSPRLVELPITSTVVQISASKFHTIALNNRGQIYVWGFGKGGRLGTGTEFDHVEPTRLTSVDEIPMVKVAAGENHTLALSRSGQVFSWGSNSFGQLGHSLKASSQESRLTPKRVDAFKGMFMTDISASGVHSGATCGDDGFLYTWGSNKRGQLGRKDGFGIDQPNPMPKRVDRLVPGHALSVIYEPHDALRAVQIAMSDVHTCAILRCSKNGQSQGQVWQFGYGSNVPTRILFKEKRRTNSHLLMNEAWLPRWKLRSDDIVSVSCAPNHSIALSACGSVYTWGHNGDALSHQKSDYIPPGTPQRVMLDKYGPIVNICASQDHCAVVAASGDLLSWGCGPQGVLGHGPGNSWQPSPKQVHGAKKVVAVAAGHQHTVVLVAPRLPQPATPKQDLTSPPKLRNLLETKIAQFLDLSNVATVWKYANVYSQLALERYCVEYMRLNWDALLAMGSKDRLDVLFDLMLARAPKAVRRVEFMAVEEKPSKTKVLSDRKTERKSSISFEDNKFQSPKPETKSEASARMVIPPMSLQAEAPPPSKPQATPATVRHVKGAKFVPVDSFFSEKEETKPLAPSPVEPSSVLSPWSASSSSAQEVPRSGSTRSSASMPAKSPTLAPTAFPSLGASVTRPPRKESSDRAPLVSSLPRKFPALHPSPSPKLSFAPSPVLEPRKQVLCYDGSERAQVSSFSLDAFIKKTTRKKSRSDSIKSAKTPTWGSVPKATAASEDSSTASPLNSLKEIQEEEQARARAEAAAKAKNGGFVRKRSSINSWGLVQQQGHISFEELQKREEEERFLEEQRQIMAQIERENRQREADEKRRLAKQEASRQRQQQPQQRLQSSSSSQKKVERKNKESAHRSQAKPAPKAKTAETKTADVETKAAATPAPTRRSKAKREPKDETKRSTENPTVSAPAPSAATDDAVKPKKRPKKPKPPQPRANVGALQATTSAASSKARQEATIDYPEEYASILSDPWEAERGEMTLLTCARKNRSLLWHRYNRAVLRRHALASRKKAALAASVAVPTGTAASGTQKQALSTAATSNQKEMLRSESIPILTKPAGGANSSSATTNSGTARQPPLTAGSELASSPSTSTSPWRALFLAFFAIMQPEPTKEPLEAESDFMEDLRVLSVPPHVSDVVNDASELFWRYDMDSYAANNHNEDRSQYVLERLLVPVGATSGSAEGSASGSDSGTATEDEASVFFCGCYDGHGGEEAVEFVQRNLYRNIKQQLARAASVSDAIVAGFQATDEQFHRHSLVKFEKGCWSSCSVGACAVIALVVDKKLYVASCGDCRAIMAFREPDGALSVEQITWDHSANDEREQERLRILHPEENDIVREVGAHNFYVKGRLQPTRSLGDTYMKVQDVNRAPMPRGLRIRGSFKRPYITAVPDVFEVDLEDRHPEFLVLGSDGLYGEMTNEEIAKEVDGLREKGVENVSQSLRASVLDRIAKYYGFSTAELEQIEPGERRNYHDDITIDVVHFTPPTCVTEEATPEAQAA